MLLMVQKSGDHHLLDVFFQTLVNNGISTASTDEFTGFLVAINI